MTAKVRAWTWLMWMMTSTLIIAMSGCGSSGSSSVAVIAGPPASILGWMPGVTRSVPTSAPLTVYFSRGVDHASVEHAWHLTPSVPGTFSWTPTSTTFTSNKPFRAASYYRLSLGAPALDDQKKPLANALQVSFATGDPLRVTSVTPAKDTRAVPLNSPLAITFNHPMVPLAGLGAVVPDPRGWHLTLSPATRGVGSWLGTSTWEFRPDRVLNGSSTYQVVLSRSARDEWGEALGADAKFSFETVPPQVFSTSPVNHAMYADPEGAVKIGFNQPMNRASTAAAFSMEAGGRVPGTITWRGSTLIFTPSAPLDPTRQYSVAIAPTARSANARAVLGRQFDLVFNVAPPPRVVSTTPIEGGTTQQNDIVLHFSTPMNVQSLDRHLVVNPPLVNMYTYISDSSNSSYGANYLVGGDFKASAAYTITLRAGAHDRLGHVLAHSFTLKLHTAPLPSSLLLYGSPGTFGGVSFSAGQVLGAPFQTINTPGVTFTLVRSTPADLASLAAQGNIGTFKPPSGTTIKSWTVNTSRALNQINNGTASLSQADGSALPAGAYWLGAQAQGGTISSAGGFGPSSEIVIASNVSITLQQSSDESLVWVTSTATGLPIPNVLVHLLSGDGSRHLSSSTDSRGVAIFRNLSNIHGEWTAFVDDGQHVGLALGNWMTQTAGQGGLAAGGLYKPSPNGTFVYTDRPIYRPGQRVHFRALLWRNQDGSYALPGPNPVRVVASDSTGHGIYGRQLIPDRFGTISGTFMIPKSAPTGSGFISVPLSAANNAGEVGTAFSVEDYRKPEFLVGLTSDRPGYVNGQTLIVTMQAKYVFGAALAGRQVSWTVSRQNLYAQPPGWEAYTFGDQDAFLLQSSQEFYGPYGPTLISGQGTTDDAGQLKIRLPLHIAKELLDQNLTVEATLMDINHQSISARLTVPVTQAAFDVGLLAQQQVTAAGGHASMFVAAVRADGTPVPGQMLTARIYRRTITSRLAPNGFSQPYWQQIPHDRLISTLSLTTDRHGQARLSFATPGGGMYFAEVEGMDPNRQIARGAVSIDAGSSSPVDFGSSSNTNILLQPDRSQYSVGQVAHVLVAAPFDQATALVTLARGEIRSYSVQHLASNSSSVTIPITADDIPNIYLSVVIYRGWKNKSAPDWRSGVIDLHVNIAPRRLIVHLAQDRSRYHPGDSATYSVRTTGSSGRPVSAEVSLALVDTAVLSLQSDSNPDIVSGLYGEFNLGVSTSSDGVASIDHLHALPRFRVEFPQGGGGGGGGLAPAATGLTRAVSHLKVRHRFADTAYWTAHLVTSAAGTASVRVRLPDNLTTWRLQARAGTVDHRVGQQNLLTLSTQDVIIRPVVPRFLLQGDSLRIGVIVNNNLDHFISVRVSSLATGISLSATNQEATIPADGERLVQWPSTVPASTTAHLTFSAVPSEPDMQGDAVSIDLPVHPPLTDETVATAGTIFKDIVQTVVVPARASRAAGDLTVQLSSALTAGMGGAYASLQPSAYDSNDDVAQRLRAAVALYSLAPSFTGMSAQAYAGLPAGISHDVGRLTNSQLADGGWPWFDGPSAVSDPAVTLDVMQALMASQATALNVSTVVRHAQLYLSSNLSRIPRLERVRIGAILAQYSPYGSQTVRSSYIDTVFRARLDPGTLADMAAAFASLGSFRTSTTLLAALDADALVSATGAHWEASGLVQNQTAVGITARVLNVLLELKPGDALVPAAARWLMLARQGDAWDCAPDTALAIQALTAYAHAAREDKASYQYAVAVNGRQTIAGAFRRGSGPHGVTTTIPIGTLPVGGPSTLVISRQSSSGTMGRGPFYYVARLHYFVRANGIRPLSQGIVVTRAYQSLGGSLVTKIAAGAMVRVRLTVRTAQTLEHLRLDDPLPAGFEAVNQSLNTSQQNISGSTLGSIGSENRDLTPYLAHMDLRDDRVSLFVPELPPGAYVYSYLAQATIAGTYGVGPTHAAEAFFPEVFGRSRGQIVTVR